MDSVSLFMSLLWLIMLYSFTTDGQTIVITGPSAVGVGDNMSLTCEFTPSGTQSVDSYAWSYTGGSSPLILNPDCTVFGVSGVTDTHERNCTGNTFSITFTSASLTTITREWCCNVGVTSGSAPSSSECHQATEGCKASELTDPSNGQVTYTSNSMGQTATYSCDPGYTLMGSSTRACQTDKTWSGSTPNCIESTTPSASTSESPNTTGSPSTVSSSQTPVNQDSGSSGLSTSVIIAIAVGGGLVVIIVVVIVIVCCYTRRKRGQTQNNGMDGNKQFQSSNISNITPQKRRNDDKDSVGRKELTAL